jgi:two-component system sensor histidine kinase SenX3
VGDSTWAFAIAALGLALGALLAWRWSERDRRAPAVATAALVPDGVESVLNVLRSSGVLVGSDGTRAEGLGGRLLDGDRSGDRLSLKASRGLVRAVRRDGQVREERLCRDRRARSRNPRTFSPGWPGWMPILVPRARG